MDFKQSSGSHRLTISRSGEMTSPVVVDWRVDPGQSSEDYDHLTGQITFAPGESTAVIILASPLSTRASSNSEFEVVLVPISEPLTAGDLSCLVNVENDITPAKIGFAVQTTDFNQSDGLKIFEIFVNLDFFNYCLILTLGSFEGHYLIF